MQRKGRTKRVGTRNHTMCGSGSGAAQNHSPPILGLLKELPTSEDLPAEMGDLHC